MIKKVGHVHVQKCAGSALNSGIYESLELNPMHISALTGNEDQLRHWDVLINSRLHHSMSNSPYVSGHIRYSKMTMMNRDFIFTAFRDPYSRFFSLYTYNVSRSFKPEVVKNHPNLKGYHEIDFLTYCESAKSNGMSQFLLEESLDKKVFTTDYTETQLANLKNTIVPSIKKALSKFDVIYFSDIQFILDDLNSRDLVPELKERKKNISSIPCVLKMGCTESDFLTLMHKKCWLDIIVCDIALELFPDTVIKTPTKPDVFLNALKERYNVEFLQDDSSQLERVA